MLRKRNIFLHRYSSAGPCAVKNGGPSGPLGRSEMVAGLNFMVFKVFLSTSSWSQGPVEDLWYHALKFLDKYRFVTM